MASPTPEVSVIIPAYRVTAYIPEAIESVLQQTFAEYEIVVVNDGCPDTEALERALHPYRARIVYLKQQNGGLAAARNTGIRAASAPFIALLDGDDKWTPDYLRIQLEKLRADPSIDVLYPDAINFGDSPLAGRRFTDDSPSSGDVTFESLLSQRCHVFVGVTARKDALTRAGLFDPSLRASEDFDMWIRLVKSGGRIAYHREPLVMYRRRGDSLSASLPMLAASTSTVLDKIERTCDLSPRERDVLTYARRRFRAYLDLHEGKLSLTRGDFAAARDSISRANSFFHTPKLSILLAALRVAPSLVRYAAGSR